MSEYSFDEFTTAAPEQIAARREIIGLARDSLEFTDSFFRLAPGFVHAGMFARQLAIFDLIKSTKNHPGHVLDFGTYTGFFATQAEVARAIVAPFDHQKKILAFDTFDGYLGFGANETESESVVEGGYATPPGYETKLQTLLSLLEIAHGKNSPSHRVVKGDAPVELERIAARENLASVSVASFDMNAYEPTKRCLEQIAQWLSPGSIVVFWQFNRGSIPGERKAYLALKDDLPPHQIESCPNYPSMVVLRVL